MQDKISTYPYPTRDFDPMLRGSVKDFPVLLFERKGLSRYRTPKDKPGKWIPGRRTKDYIPEPAPFTLRDVGTPEFTEAVDLLKQLHTKGWYLKSVMEREARRAEKAAAEVRRARELELREAGRRSWRELRERQSGKLRRSTFREPYPHPKREYKPNRWVRRIGRYCRPATKLEIARTLQSSLLASAYRLRQEWEAELRFYSRTALPEYARQWNELIALQWNPWAVARVVRRSCKIKFD